MELPPQPLVFCHEKITFSLRGYGEKGISNSVDSVNQVPCTKHFKKQVKNHD